MKTSDEKLAQQIKAVFEDYDDGLAENGWAAVREKYPEKETKKLPIWWISGIAASLILAVGLYFNQAFDTEKVILNANTSKKDTSVSQSLQNSKADIKIAATEKASTNEKNITAENPVQKSLHPKNNITLNQQFAVVPKQSVNPDKKPDDLKVTTNVPQQKSTTVIDEKIVIAAANTESNNAGKNLPGSNITVENDTKPTNETKATKLTTEEFLAAQSKMLAATDSKKESKKNSTPTTTLDVFTGTFFNYHDDNEAKLSAGVGLNANVKLAKNVVFSFGAGISQNKVSYENQVPTQVADAMFTSKNAALNAAPVSGATYSATATNDVSFNGSMLSIDLPMVVKLYPTSKQDFYISTGINSSTYLSQKYTYNYSVSNFSVQNGTAQPQQQTEKSSLSGFDFANSAIIAIGINQNIGKNTLIFEPYYKPALSAMGDKNLRISSAGLNLKFNFNGGKR
ncbi:MAG: hypothetical protein EOO98_08780 [Pedobacter sp.]|nr:MAG: hypothetical protein EOO98_08780 [Pedobacter sp.]